MNFKIQDMKEWFWLFEEATGPMYEKGIQEHFVKIMAEECYRDLMASMACRPSTGFINDGGPRHIKNRDDKIGVTYAFWLPRDQKKWFL